MDDRKSDFDDFVVRIRGLPWSAKEAEVREFFSDCSDIRGVHFTFTKELRPTGEAFVEFGNKHDVDIALSKHKEIMKSRYIEVFFAKRGEMEFILKRSAPIVPLISAGGANDNVVRLRGLPFGCTAHDIEEFFAGLPIADEGIVRPIDRTGRVTGEAYVKFLDKEATEQALAKHMKEIGNRYIEIFRSTEAEMYVAKYPDGGGPNDELYFGKGQSSRKRLRGINSSGIPSLLDTIDLHENKSVLKSSKIAKNFIGTATGHLVHMRGLPFTTTATDIVEFFQPIKVLNILVLFDERSGKPTGEADVEFLHHTDAVNAMQKDKQHMGERYVELFMDSVPSPTPFLDMSTDEFTFGNNGFQALGGPMQMHNAYGYGPGPGTPADPTPYPARRPFGLSAYPPSYY